MAETRDEAEIEDSELLEVSLKIGDNIFKQILFDKMADVDYAVLVKNWSSVRPISEVFSFIWARNDNGFVRRYLIKDTDDLRSALRTSHTITIGAQGHSQFQRNWIIGIVMFMLVHFYYNISLVWPLCREDMLSLCLTSVDGKTEL